MHYISFDQWTDDNKPLHSILNIEVSGTTGRSSGKLGESLKLDGGYASLGRQEDTCFGNLDVCRQGALLTFWIKPISLENGMDIISTGRCWND